MEYAGDLFCIGAANDPLGHDSNDFYDLFSLFIRRIFSLCLLDPEALIDPRVTYSPHEISDVDRLMQATRLHMLIPYITNKNLCLQPLELILS